MRAVDRLAVACTAGWISIAASGATGDWTVRATVDAPAEIPVTHAATASGAAGPQRLIVSVTGFAPSPAGPVEGVVTIRCGVQDREIGRFGIFPYSAFSAKDPSKARRFGFALPDEAACRDADRVTVRLEPSLGDGRAASMDIGEASIE